MPPMDRERWRLLGPLLDEALELPPDRQAVWLADLRRRAPELAAELETLIARERDADREGFLATPPPTPGAPRPLSAIRLGSHYTLVREIGRGGMATVYLADDGKHRRRVAIKVLHPELTAALRAERFLEEIELTASLHHPHILPLFDSGSADGLLYSVMPLVEGESLRDRLRREGRLPIDEAVRLAREVAGALAYAHERGIVHRDVKPENILLQDGRALLADFGIARASADLRTTQTLTRTGMSVGTPAYMSPEQA
ncbi:MAG TPA: serine/threonine-protein kinase, partial [Gemmatimonadaceae bacterium]|nr:serine/threonine-protein kinase [Gemmatimonadaceae bacterium]